MNEVRQGKVVALGGPGGSGGVEWGGVHGGQKAWEKVEAGSQK